MLNAAGLNLYDLVSAAVMLHKEAATDGGEYQGPCPWCGGEDRFHVWPDAERPHYWCRQCDRQGDTIQWLRDHDGLSFPEAAQLVGKPLDTARAARTLTPPRRLPTPDAAPPSTVWQARGCAVLAATQTLLQGDGGAAARAYLQSRGLTDATIAAAGIGYCPADKWSAPEAWGLDGKKIYLSAGIVIPHQAAGHLWGLNVRRLDGREPKYVKPRGSVGALYGADQLAGHPVVVLVEGELDALLLRQEAGDLVDVVTRGSASAPLGPRWLWALRHARRVLVAYDTDVAGVKGAAALEGLSARVRVARPFGANDFTEMHQSGGDLRAWVQAQLARHGPTALAAETPAARVCIQCEAAPVAAHRQWICATCDQANQRRFGGAE
jgi:DNA primase